MNLETTTKPVKGNPVSIKSPAAVLAFYLKLGHNGQPHWRFVQPERVRQIFESILPKLKTDFQINVCQDVLNQL